MAIRRRRTGREGYRSTDGYTVLPTPRDRYYADPFIVAHGGRQYLFFEDFPFERSKGMIGCMALDPAGRPTEAEVVLERPYHLSFPCVFDWAGEVWMIPETSANRTIELYRAVRFPHVWRPEKRLMEGLQASDTTVLFHDGNVWLFTSLERPGKYAYNELHLFRSRSLLGDWVPHAGNPVVRDVARARPAGRVFEDAGALIRPGQDCSRGYGYGVQFSQIEVLNPREYAEVPCGRTIPDWLPNGAGTHTYNCNEEFEVRDGNRTELDVYGKWLAVAGRGRRLLGRRGARAGATAERDDARSPVAG